MNREAHHRLLVFSSNLEDDDESRSWFVVVLSCFASIVKDDNEPSNLLSFSTFFFQVQKTMTMSWDHGSLCSLVVLLQLCESKKYHKETNAKTNYVHIKRVVQKV